MKKISVPIFIILFSINLAIGQSYVKFSENKLRQCCNPYAALLNCPVDSSKAEVIFQTVLKLDIPIEHINGYCEARAEFICQKIAPLLYGENCEIGKIWAFSPSITSLVSNKTFSSKNPLFPNDSIKWEYHVAPVFAIKNEMKIDTIVIDFSINNNKLIKYKDWLKALNCKEAIYTFTDDSYYLFNTLDGLQLDGKDFNNQILPNNFPKIITGHFYYLDPSNKNWISSGLAYNELAIYLISNYYNDPKYVNHKTTLRQTTRLNNLKALINDNTSKLPSEIKQNAKKYFGKRNEYWEIQLK